MGFSRGSLSPWYGREFVFGRCAEGLGAIWQLFPSLYLLSRVYNDLVSSFLALCYIESTRFGEAHMFTRHAMRAARSVLDSVSRGFLFSQQDLYATDDEVTRVRCGICFVPNRDT